MEKNSLWMSLSFAVFIVCSFAISSKAGQYGDFTRFNPALYAISFFALPAWDAERTIGYDLTYSSQQKVEVQQTKIPAFQKGKVSKTNKGRMTDVLKYLFIGVGVLAVLGVALFMGSRMNR